MTDEETFPELRDPPQEGYPYGIIDPDYARAYSIMRIICWQHGYALALHGSFTRDLDLIAIPWRERVTPIEMIIKHMAESTKTKLQDEKPGIKEHGRLAWTFLFPGFEDPRWIDFSATPRIKKEKTDVLPD